MKILIAVIMVCLLYACKQTNKEMKEQLVLADSVAINYFKGDGTMDTVVAVKIVKDKKIIEELAQTVTENVISNKTGCGFDGSLHFFKSNIVMQDVYFSVHNKDCRQFLYSYMGKKYAASFTTETDELLTQLKK